MLARALLGHNPSSIAGEVFNINDGEPRLFWRFVRDIWKVAVHEEKIDLATKFPTWLVLTPANVQECLFWVFNFGRKRPGLLGKQQIENCCFMQTYKIDKERLGFVPKQNYEEMFGKSVKRLLGGYNQTDE